MESVLIITGSMGSGKSVILAEASDLLAARSIPHAAIDLDALGAGHFSAAVDRDQWMYRNLQLVCENCTSAGVSRMILARAIENAAEMQLCSGIVSARSAIVCRLTASVEVMQRRVKMRESGILQVQLIARVSELEERLDRAHVENFRVRNQDRTVTDVAAEMLAKAGWIQQIGS